MATGCWAALRRSFPNSRRWRTTVGIHARRPITTPATNAMSSTKTSGVAPIAASAAGFATGATVKYWLNYSVAFRSNARHSSAMARFAVALAALMVLNTLLFAVFQRGLGLHYLVAQALTTILLIPPGY